MPSSNYISVGVQYTNDQIFIGEISFTTGTLSNIANSKPFYGFSEGTGSANIEGGTFAAFNYVMKVAPLSNYAYNLISSYFFY